MLELGKRLRARAEQLGLSDAEVARRADLAPRRYGFYVTGDRRPDYETLARICQVLATTPNHLLGFEKTERVGTKAARERKKLQDKLIAASNVLELQELRLAVKQVEAIVEQQE